MKKTLDLILFLFVFLGPASVFMYLSISASNRADRYRTELRDSTIEQIILVKKLTRSYAERLDTSREYLEFRQKTSALVDRMNSLIPRKNILDNMEFYCVANHEWATLIGVGIHSSAPYEFAFGSWLRADGTREPIYRTIMTPDEAHTIGLVAQRATEVRP